MTYHIPDRLKEIARDLRNNMTESEKLLWNHIRWDTLWVRILRQKIFYVYTENNWYDRFIIPDFYIANKKLIIEVDGSIHKVSEIMNLDKIKDELIMKRWFKILRITNEEIQNDIQKVLIKIKQEL